MRVLCNHVSGVHLVSHVSLLLNRSPFLRVCVYLSHNPSGLSVSSRPLRASLLTSPGDGREDSQAGCPSAANQGETLLRVGC